MSSGHLRRRQGVCRRVRQGIPVPRLVGQVARYSFVKSAGTARQRDLAGREKTLDGFPMTVSAVESKKRGRANCLTVWRINVAVSSKFNRMVHTSSISDISVRAGPFAPFSSFRVSRVCSSSPSSTKSNLNISVTVPEDVMISSDRRRDNGPPAAYLGTLLVGTSLPQYYIHPSD